MGVVLAAVGALLVASACADAVLTTLSAGNRGGPLTARIAARVWIVLRAASSSERARTLSYAGMLVLLSTVLTWVLLLWTGWTLVFSSADGAVVSSTTGLPASTSARTYFAAFVVFTLGVGDYKPGEGGWQVLTGLASFVGLFLVTLSITYLVSVVSAAVSRRSLARQITLSGVTGAQIVLLHWDGTRVSSGFDALSSDLVQQVVQTTQQHLAYPVLHCFHASTAASSAPRALAALDDALLILSAGVSEHVAPGQETLVRLRRALEHYAETVASSGGIRSARRGPAAPPPLPDLSVLRDAGVPTVSDAQFAGAAASSAHRRQGLADLVALDAWSWPTS